MRIFRGGTAGELRGKEPKISAHPRKPTSRNRGKRPWVKGEGPGENYHHKSPRVGSGMKVWYLWVGAHPEGVKPLKWFSQSNQKGKVHQNPEDKPNGIKNGPNNRRTISTGEGVRTSSFGGYGGKKELRGE